MRVALVLAALALALAGVACVNTPPATPASAQTAAAASERTISVSGTGTASVAPDVLIASIGAQVQNDDLGRALDEASRRINDVSVRLRSAGVAAEDIQTSRLYVNQIPRNPSNPRPGETTFEVFNGLSVRIRNLSQAGSILTAATTAGANRIDGVDFTIDDPTAARQQARQQALQKAAATARELAGNAGLQLGEIVAINEGAQFDGPVFDGRGGGLGAGAAASDIPIQGGRLQVNVSVTVRYAIR